MPAERIQGQTITLTNGTKVTGKTVRRATPYLFGKLAGFYPTPGTLGTAKVNGYEIPVRRTRGRNGPWKQEGAGRPNVTCGYDNIY